VVNVQNITIHDVSPYIVCLKYCSTSVAIFHLWKNRDKELCRQH
jgi:hypothetical protein